MDLQNKRIGKIVKNHSKIVNFPLKILFLKMFPTKFEWRHQHNEKYAPVELTTVIRVCLTLE